MGRRIADFFRSDLGVLLLIAAARFVLYVATNGQYGFHRDELQTLDDARHLDGPALGLPHAMSLTNSFWYRGYDPRQPQTVIVTGFDLDEGKELFESCVVAAKNTNSFGVVNEESRFHPDILLCRNLRLSWPVYWERFRRYG